MLEKYGSGTAPLPTPLDLYRELLTATSDSLQHLLHDIFAAHTFWELETNKATARQNNAGKCEVDLDVKASKVVVDMNGLEALVPMNDWIEIREFAPAEKGLASDKPIYLQKYGIHSGAQTTVVTVLSKLVHAAINS
ncbi:hypothetical protein [Cesiribacter sp. SM1]|uniref:hypothetical protein n=1 Tax=Cesiribacter sp. SM1 TaxID=2861196 RepID=UPI001CD3433D|nr:hypothetical protein [Cesiribacter sp. SM1]